MARRIAIVNSKGGTGKTTTAFTLAAIFAARGQRVLVIDMDAQAAATQLLVPSEQMDPVRRRAYLFPTIVEVLLRGQTLMAAVKPSLLDQRIALVPSTLAMREADGLVPFRSPVELRLARALDGVDERFDVILIDCPGHLLMGTRLSLCAAGEFVVPIEPARQSLFGAGDLLHEVAQVRRRANPGLRLAGLLVTKMGEAPVERRNLAAIRADAAQQGWRVFGAVIPQSDAVKTAETASLPVTRYLPRNPASLAYEAFADELLGMVYTEGKTAGNTGG